MFKFYIIITRPATRAGQSGNCPPRNFHKRMYLLGAATSYIILPENISWLRPWSSLQRNLILRLSRRLSNSSTKSSKSVFQLVPFNLKYINVTQSSTGNGISGKDFHEFHFLKNFSRMKHWWREELQLPATIKRSSSSSYKWQKLFERYRQLRLFPKQILCESYFMF